MAWSPPTHRDLHAALDALGEALLKAVSVVTDEIHQLVIAVADTRSVVRCPCFSG